MTNGYEGGAEDLLPDIDQPYCEKPCSTEARNFGAGRTRTQGYLTRASLCSIELEGAREGGLGLGQSQCQSTGDDDISRSGLEWTGPEQAWGSEGGSAHSQSTMDDLAVLCSLVSRQVPLIARLFLSVVLLGATSIVSGLADPFLIAS
jgi:hypothetical protein